MRLLPLLLLPLAATATAGIPLANDRGPGLPGTRQGETTTWAVRDFDRIAFGADSTVTVRVGPAFSLTATGPAAALEKLRVTRENDTLAIGNRYRNWQDRDRLQRQLRFTITLPRLTDVALGGSGDMTVDRVEGGAFSAAVGGSGELRLARLAVDDARLAIGGSGNLTAAGTARRLNASVGGSGELDAAGLRARSATISSAGAGHVRASVDGEAAVTAVGSGTVEVGGKPICQVTRMGSARIRCGS